MLAPFYALEQNKFLKVNSLRQSIWLAGDTGTGEIDGDTGETGDR